MSETKQAFSIDKPGAYKTRDGQVVDIVEVTVTGRSAFGWFRTDTAPCPLRRWDTSGRGYIPIPHDIIEAIPFVVDGPGRYMMRDGRVAIVDQMDRQNSVSGQRIGGWYKSTADSQKTDTSWHVDGAWYAIKGIDNNRDLVRKMHPLEQEPVTKAPKEQKAPELKNTSEAPTFRIDTPGIYRTRDGRLVDIEGVGNNAVGTFVADPLYHHFWNLDGRTTSGLEASSDIIQKIKSKHPEPPAIGSRDKTAAEVANVLDKPAFKITEPGVYCTRNGRVVNIHEVTSTTAHGHWKVSGNKREWPLNGRTHASIDLGSDIVMKAPSVAGVLKITDVLTRLRTDWDRRLAEQEEQSRKNSRGPKTPETTTTPPAVHVVVPGIEGKPTQQPSEEQLKLAYTEPPKPVTAKKPTVAITQTGKYRTRDGRIATITGVFPYSAIGILDLVGAPIAWMDDGRFNEHCESGEDIVEMVEQHVEAKTLDPVAKWSEEAMRHIEEYVAIINEKGGPMDPLIEDALRVFRPDLCPPNAGQEKTGAEVLSALGKAATKVADEPKKRSAGFDMVMIQNHGALHHITVAGVYSINNGVATVLPVEGDMTQVAIVCGKFPEQHNVMMLTKGDRVTCPAHNVTCVIHCGLEE